jgi:acyl carrier protein
MDRGEVKSRLRDMIVRELRLQGVKPEEIGDDQPLAGGRLGFDSIDILELIVAIEKHFQVRIKDGDAAALAFRSVDALTDYVMAHAPGKQA